MDIKTLIMMLALGNLTLATALLLFDFGMRKSLDASWWSYAKMVQALAWFLLGLRGDIHDLLSIFFGNVLILCGIALEAAAMWEDSEHIEWRRYLWLPLGIGLGIFALTYVSAQPPNVLVGVVSLAVCVLYVCGASGMRWRSATRLGRFIVASTYLLAGIIAMRAGWAWVMPEQASIMANSWLQDLTFISMYLLMLVNGFGFLLISREKQELELQRLAVVDPLTDAPNRRGFYNALSPWMALARRPGHSTALIMLDLDFFKRVNDTYGHQVGDVVLKTVVEVGQKQLRDSDMLGRLGGEEFAVLLPRTNLSDALQVAERMRQAISQMPIKTERALIYITASMGVTTIRPDDSIVSLFKRADEALYAAKEGGRNSVKEAPAVGEILA